MKTRIALLAASPRSPPAPARRSNRSPTSSRRPRMRSTTPPRDRIDDREQHPRRRERARRRRDREPHRRDRRRPQREQGRQQPIGDPGRPLLRSSEEGSGLSGARLEGRLKNSSDNCCGRRSLKTRAWLQPSRPPGRDHGQAHAANSACRGRSGSRGRRGSSCPAASAPC